MSLNAVLRRRSLLGATLALGTLGSSAWSQTNKPSATAKGPVIAQIADMSAGQIDISKDFLVGARAALQDLNLKGGLRGKPVQHMTLETDGSASGLKAVVESIKANPQVIAVMGTVGDKTARNIGELLRKELPDVAHVAPWLQDSHLDSGDNTFSIFASRQEQAAYAVKSLAVMGVQEIGSVYANPAEFASYRDDVEQAAKSLRLRCKHFGPVADLQQLGRSLAADSPRILLFMGGTPELIQFTQGIDKQASLRYVVAMSDVNLQSLQQTGMSRHAPVIATQVVPLVNANVQLVRNYRDAMGRLFDEPPTPQSLAGYASARYCIDVLQAVEGTLTRSAALAAFQRRSVVDLGGFKVDPDKRRRGSAFVTQSMIAVDGRLVG